jgi:hypothetical protein
VKVSDIFNYLPTVVLLLLLGAIYFSRHAIQTWLTKGISHHFDRQLESLRADLRAKDEKIAALRQNALTGAIRRREALDKRRLEAIEGLWGAVIELAPLQWASKSMTSINFEASSKAVENNLNARKFFELIGKTYDLEKLPRSVGAKERPFVSAKAWALFSAYQAILFYGVMQIKVLEMGENMPQLLKHEHVEALVQAAMPEQMDNLKKFGTSFSHHLIEPLEELLLAELKENLEGGKATEEDLQMAAQILSASENIFSEIETEKRNLSR